MWKIALCCALLLTWVLKPAVSAGEETYPGRWWNVPEVAERLHLNDRNKKELDTLYDDNRHKLRELKRSLESQQSELGEALEKEPINEDEVREKHDKLEAARSRLNTERFRYLMEMRKMLGPERFRGLEQQYKDAREKRERGSRNLHLPPGQRESRMALRQRTPRVFGFHLHPRGMQQARAMRAYGHRWAAWM
jgi:Spy/CpxP family protein refolding chaperone